MKKGKIMSDKTRAKKLAAAKKKLKEYQTKEKHLIDVDSSDTSEYGGSNTKKHHQDQQQQQSIMIHDTQQHYQQQQQIQHQYQQQQQEEVISKNVNKDNEISSTKELTTNNDNRNGDKLQQQEQNGLNPISEYFKNSSEDFIKTTDKEQVISVKVEPMSVTGTITTANPKNFIQTSSEKTHLNAMEILIAEKASLTAELTKQQTLYKEKILENEELVMQLQMATNRNKLLENEINELHIQSTNLNSNLDDLNKRYNELKYECEREKLKNNEMKEHLDEIKHEFNEEHKRNIELEKRLKDKSCELELCQIRINQISDEANLATDNRVEVLTQTKFMYEQQIRDLQAMVQQLTTEKDQSNQQYQNYVQHLNKEITNLSEKNSELITDNEKLANRERTLIEHIGNLEKQIQENIAKQENLKKEINHVENSTSNDNEKSEFEKEIKILLEEKLKIENEVQLKDHKIEEIVKNLIEKDNYIKELEDKIENILLEKPDNNKLLATMESDKIAASRAILQNEKLKTQLNEIEQKLIQVTNDKVELVNLLDSEQYKNRKIRENYDEMEKQLKETKDKLHFKDEEMIRLTHEHNELNKTILQLNQRIDRLMHYEAKEYLRRKRQDNKENENQEDQSGDNSNANANNNENDKKDGSNKNITNSCYNKDHHDHSHENHNHDHHHHHHEKEENCEISDDAQECLEDSDSKLLEIKKDKILHEDKNNSINSDGDHNVVNGIPTHEAMEKLQKRFRKLMLEVADLTDEKQRLEHLVGQLQGETETIGEYIALYQTQRRLLKQKEIEKTTQLHMLLAEREEMRDKISNLTQLVENLIHGYGKNQMTEINLTPDIKNAVTENNGSPVIKNSSIDNNIQINYDNDENTNANKNLSNVVEFNENSILTKIHNIIAEIKQKEDNLEANLKFVPSVDHCACCSGKFETI